MTPVKELTEYYEQQFANFERKRMYPIGYGKEGTMIKPKMKHVSAITRSVNLLESGLADELVKRFHNAIERDLGLMREVKAMLFEMIENPTLPFMEVASGIAAINLIPDPEPDKPILDEIEAEPDGAF